MASDSCRLEGASSLKTAATPRETCRGQNAKLEKKKIKRSQAWPRHQLRHSTGDRNSSSKGEEAADS
jgi:hypothetical protein